MTSETKRNFASSAVNDHHVSFPGLKRCMPCQLLNRDNNTLLVSTTTSGDNFCNPMNRWYFDVSHFVRSNETVISLPFCAIGWTENFDTWFFAIFCNSMNQQWYFDISHMICCDFVECNGSMILLSRARCWQSSPGGKTDGWSVAKNVQQPFWRK